MSALPPVSRLDDEPVPIIISNKEKEMIEKIWDELRYVRSRLDDHIRDEDDKMGRIYAKLSRLAEDVGSHRTQVAVVSGIISLVIAGLVTAYFSGA